MLASVIILTKNGGDNFPLLLKSVYEQKSIADCEVIVIDSGSTDNTLNEASRYPVRLEKINPEEFHHGRTRNLGAEMAQGGYLVFITQDALPIGDSWLTNLIGNFADENVAMVVGRQIAWDSVKPPEKFFYNYYFPTERIGVIKNAANYYRDNVFISDVNSAMRRDIWKQYRFSGDILTAEDNDIAARILLDGLSVVYDPGAAVYHAHDMSIRDVFLRNRDFGATLKKEINKLPASSGSALSKAVSFFFSEVTYLRREKKLGWLPYTFIYELARYAGLICGKYGMKAEKSKCGNIEN